MFELGKFFPGTQVTPVESNDDSVAEIMQKTIRKVDLANMRRKYAGLPTKIYQKLSRFEQLNTQKDHCVIPHMQSIQKQLIDGFSNWLVDWYGIRTFVNVDHKTRANRKVTQRLGEAYLPSDNSIMKMFDGIEKYLDGSSIQQNDISSESIKKGDFQMQLCFTHEKYRKKLKNVSNREELISLLQEIIYVAYEDLLSDMEIKTPSIIGMPSEEIPRQELIYPSSNDIQLFGGNDTNRRLVELLGNPNFDFNIRLHTPVQSTDSDIINPVDDSITEGRKEGIREPSLKEVQGISIDRGYDIRESFTYSLTREHVIYIHSVLAEKPDVCAENWLRDYPGQEIFDITFHSSTTTIMSGHEWILTEKLYQSIQSYLTGEEIEEATKDEVRKESSIQAPLVAPIKSTPEPRNVLGIFGKIKLPSKSRRIAEELMVLNDTDLEDPKKFLHVQNKLRTRGLTKEIGFQEWFEEVMIPKLEEFIANQADRFQKIYDVIASDLKDFIKHLEPREAQV